MPVHPLYGHEAVRGRLANAVAAGRLPQSLLIEGPRGVGKQRLALWLGQLLLCEGPSRDEPCGQCRACRLVLSLSHPDLAWYVPLEPSRKAGDQDKQVDLTEQALADEMTRRRDQPFYEAPPGTATHSIATVRLLLRKMALTPALGGWRVVIVGDAERLIPQQANPDAANALLKVLEEPPHRTAILLTSSEPDALLRTIVSRVVRVRLSLVSDSVITSFVQRELSDHKKGPATASKVALARGSIGRLLAPQGAASEPEASAFLTAARTDAAARYGHALRQPPYQARGGFTAMLDALLDRLRAETQAGGNTEKLVEAIARVTEARVAAQGNVNPQLLAAVLADDLAGAERTGE
jgi:DNA polymerase-3 subunit delta'